MFLFSSDKSGIAEPYVLNFLRIKIFTLGNLSAKGNLSNIFKSRE